MQSTTVCIYFLYSKDTFLRKNSVKLVISSPRYTNGSGVRQHYQVSTGPIKLKFHMKTPIDAAI